VKRWTLEHKLMRDTLSCLPASAHAPNPFPKPRYLQFLSLSHHPSHGFVYASGISPPSAAQPATAPASAATVMRTIPPAACTTLFQHFVHACEPLWCHRHTVVVPTGIAYDVGDFRIRMGDVRQTQPVARVRGTVVEIEWRGPSSLSSLYDDDDDGAGQRGNVNEGAIRSESAPDVSLVLREVDVDCEYAQTAQLIRDFWAQFGIEGIREAIIVPDIGKEAKAKRQRQLRNEGMRGDHKIAAGGTPERGWGEQDDDPDPDAGVDLARQYMEIFRFNR
jgi:hypothetical protein